MNMRFAFLARAESWAAFLQAAHYFFLNVFVESM
jgi:hypothetical protein